MPTFSYLAYPVENKKERLVNDLNSIPGCFTEPAENKNLLVLVTETMDKNEEELLQKKLANINSLAYLAMVSAYTEDV